jgi:hypothetical protein
MPDITVVPITIEQLIPIWKVLEDLTVSLDRLGEYERIHGQEAAKAALHAYVTPALSQNIAQARHVLVSILEKHDSSLMDYLERLADDEATIGYWDGPA